MIFPGGRRGGARHGLFALTLLVFLQTGACVEAFETFFGPADVLSNRMESRTVDAIAARKEAAMLANRAAETKDPQYIDQAVAARPKDGYYRNQQAALALARGDMEQWRSSRARAKALVDPTLTDDPKREDAASYLLALEVYIDAYPGGSTERNRLVTEYCAITNFSGLGSLIDDC